MIPVSLMRQGEAAKRDLIRLAAWKNGDPAPQQLKKEILAYIEKLEEIIINEAIEWKSPQ